MSRMIVDARVCRWKDKDGGWMLAASRRWHKMKVKTWYACRRDLKKRYDLACVTVMLS